MLAADADVEVAVETSPAFRDLLAERDADHPYAVVDDQLVVRSRYPDHPAARSAGRPGPRILRALDRGPLRARSCCTRSTR